MAEAVDNPHKYHFRLAYLGLALLFWISAGGFVVLLLRGHSQRTPEASWSAWRPTGAGLLGAQQIGHQVSHHYQAADGSQLAVVQEHLPVVQGLRLEGIGVRRVMNNGVLDPYIGLFGTSGTVIYAFCGLRSNCAIDNADAASQLLRREALELSLYSFKYLKGVDQVVSLVQTSTAGHPTAVFLRKSQLTAELAHPLADTLPFADPPPVGQPDARESDLIDTLTSQNTFPAHFEPLPDGDAILVLDVSSSS